MLNIFGENKTSRMLAQYEVDTFNSEQIIAVNKQIDSSYFKHLFLLFQLHVHNKDYEALYKHVPKEILPTEYGGNGGSIKEIIGWCIRPLCLHSENEMSLFGCSCWLEVLRYQ